MGASSGAELAVICHIAWATGPGHRGTLEVTEQKHSLTHEPPGGLQGGFFKGILKGLFILYQDDPL